MTKITKNNSRIQKSLLICRSWYKEHGTNFHAENSTIAWDIHEKSPPWLAQLVDIRTKRSSYESQPWPKRISLTFDTLGNAKRNDADLEVMYPRGIKRRAAFPRRHDRKACPARERATERRRSEDSFELRLGHGDHEKRGVIDKTKKKSKGWRRWTAIPTPITVKEFKCWNAARRPYDCTVLSYMCFTHILLPRSWLNPPPVTGTQYLDHRGNTRCNMYTVHSLDPEVRMSPWKSVCFRLVKSVCFRPVKPRCAPMIGSLKHHPFAADRFSMEDTIQEAGAQWYHGKKVAQMSSFPTYREYS